MEITKITQNLEEVKIIYDNPSHKFNWDSTNNETSYYTFDKNNIKFSLIKIFPNECKSKPKPFSYKEKESELDTYENVDVNSFNFTKADKSNILLVLEYNIFGELATHRFINTFNSFTESRNKDFDILFGNSFPIAKYQLVFTPRFYEILPQYIDSEVIPFRALTLYAFLTDYEENKNLV